MPPQKKEKVNTSPDTSSIHPGLVLANSTKGSQEHICDKDGYVIDVVKKWADYVNGDLPMQVDTHWSWSFIPTAMLWFSIQTNIWNIPDDELAAALQKIFNMIYPDVKYHITTTGSVFSVVSVDPIL